MHTTVSCTLLTFSCESVPCSITYDKYFQEYHTNSEPKAWTYLKISPKNVDRRLMKEYFVYSWTNFFSDMGSYIGLLLGWSFLSVLEMVIDFLDILIRKKLTVNELTVEELANNETAEDITSLRPLSTVSSLLSENSDHLSLNYSPVPKKREF